MHNIDEPVLDSTERQDRRPQAYLSLAGILMLVTALAMVFWVGTNWKRYLGFAEAVLICAIPFSVVIEAAFGKYPQRESLSTREELQRAGRLLISTVVPAMAGLLLRREELPTFSPALTLAWINGLEAWSINKWYLAELPLVGVYLALSTPVICNRSLKRLPLRSLLVLLFFTGISIVTFNLGIDDLIRKHGINHVLFFGTVNILVVLSLWSSWIVLRRRFTTVSILGWNIVLSIWLFGFALPL